MFKENEAGAIILDHQQRFWQNRAVFLYLTPKLSGISEKIYKFAFKYNIL